MVIWYNNIDTKEDFFGKVLIDDQKFLYTLNYDFFLLSPLLNQSNSLEIHLWNLSSP